MSLSLIELFNYHWNNYIKYSDSNKYWTTKTICSWVIIPVNCTNYILRLERQFARKPPLLSQILFGFVLIFFQNSMYIYMCSTTIQYSVRFIKRRNFVFKEIKLRLALILSKELAFIHVFC